MNRNLFSIILLFCILAQTIDACSCRHHHHHHHYFNNRCTVTETSSETATVTQCSESQTPTPTPDRKRHNHHYNHHHDNHHHCNHHHHNHECNHHKPTKTVIITPTVTVCPDCCNVGGPGFQNQIRPGGNGVVTNDATAQDCCKSCLANPACAQWAFLSQICQHNVGNTCVSPDLADF